MNRKEIDLLLSRMEGLKSLLEDNSLENFQQEILRVENFLKRFGSLDELLTHLGNVEKIAYTAKDFLNIYNRKNETYNFLKRNVQFSLFFTPSKQRHLITI